jgi:hypothetical protein
MRKAIPIIIITLFLSACAEKEPELAKPTLENKETGTPAQSTQEKDRIGKLFIETLPVYVKGFPMIFKLKCLGEQSVPLITIFEQTAEIKVNFSQRGGDSNKVYTIVSYNPAIEIERITKDGFTAPGDPKDFRICVPSGEQYDVLLDIASLRGTKNAATIESILAGSYSVYVVFPFSGTKSETVDIEICSPSEEEEEFLRLLAERNTLRRSWSMRLITRDNFTELKWNVLGDAARSQIAFHAMLAIALSKNNSLDEGLKWRFEGFKNRGRHFLRR